MAGNREGGLKAAQRNKELYGEDYYSRIGAVGGKNGDTGGFYYGKHYRHESDPAHPSNAGRKGGHISRRGKKQ